MTSQEILTHFENDNEAINSIVFEKRILLDFKKYSKSVFFQIEFVNCHFKGRFYFVDLLDEFVEVKFTHCKFDDEFGVRFRNLELYLLEFNSCSFNNLFLKNVSSDNIKFTECEILKKIQIAECKTEDLEVLNNQIAFRGEFLINSPNLQTMIQAKQGISKVSIQAIDSASIEGNFDEIDLDIRKFNKIEIEDYFELNELMSTKIQRLNFNNSNFEGDLILQNIYINELNFNSLLSNNGSIRMNEVDLENSSFNDCTISSFYWNQVKFINEPEIIRCDLSNLKISNVYWKNGKKLKDSFLDEDIPWLYEIRLNKLKKQDLHYHDYEIAHLKYQRDTYRQLKAASIANHNQIDALAFYKNEMNLYWKEIRIEGGEKWYDRILIFLSRWVSNFGQNWFMPLLWLVGVHFIFMMCIFNWDLTSSIAHGKIEYGFLGEYFQLINPIHKLPDYINTDGGKVADFFMRIFGGYFIYHFIKASRKFLEK